MARNEAELELAMVRCHELYESSAEIHGHVRLLLVGHYTADFDFRFLAPLQIPSQQTAIAFKFLSKNGPQSCVSSSDRGEGRSAL